MRHTAAVRVASMVSEGATVGQAIEWVLRRLPANLRRYYGIRIEVDIMLGGLI